MSDTLKTNKNDATISEKCLKRVVIHLDKFIKIASFVAAFGILALFGAIGGALIYIDKVFTTVAIGVFIVGVIISLITLFTIYGIGQIISQNNIILKSISEQ